MPFHLSTTMATALVVSASRRLFRFRASSQFRGILAALGAAILLPGLMAADAPLPAPRSPATPTDTIVKLDDFVVRDNAVSDRPEAAAIDLRQVPGAALLIKAEDVARNHLATAADLLQFQPGVYAQTAIGNEGLRLSIRGSGINNTATYKSGVNFLFEGLLFPGLQAVPPVLFEPLTVEYTEILPGANAFNYQALALGGAINFVTRTGRNASPFELRADAGSFGYYKAQLASGTARGPFDYYASITAGTYDGFQDHTAQHSARLVANLGYRLSPRVTTRFYLRRVDMKFENGGLLTRAQIEADPSQANATTARSQAYSDVRNAYWLANKTIVALDGHSELEAGFVYDSVPFYINSAGVAGSYAGVYWEKSISPSLLYKRSDELFGRASRTTLGLRNVTALQMGNRTVDYSVPTSATYGQTIRQLDYNGAATTVFSASNELEVSPSLWLKTGVSGIATRIANHIVLPVGSDNSHSVQREGDYGGIVGLLYQAKPGVQTFVNVSRTVEPPTTTNLTNTSTYRSLNPLRNQSAVTVETGVRGKAGIFEGSLSLYRSAVRNELLTVATVLTPTVITQTQNASPTTHQGIEAGLSTTLWRDAGGGADATRLVLRQAYTLNSFHFNQDPTWGSLALPGIPRDFYQGELLFEHRGGFYASATAQSASRVSTDYANSFFTAPYTIFGAKLGYAPPRGRWEAHLQLSNLTDRHYAVYVRQTYNARGADTAVSGPGDGFGVFGGFSFRY
ncbi:MAG TPA: TonB-dependent receptor [Bryobacteraceae bacterium]|nr:TonB-dependent receptor [Bryobacteraceae bacterium]